LKKSYSKYLRSVGSCKKTKKTINDNMNYKYGPKRAKTVCNVTQQNYKITKVAIT